MKRFKIWICLGVAVAALTAGLAGCQKQELQRDEHIGPMGRPVYTDEPYRPREGVYRLDLPSWDSGRYR